MVSYPFSTLLTRNSIDCNFLLKVDSNEQQEKYLLKFYNAVESGNTVFLDALGSFCETLSSSSARENIAIPRPILSLNGSTYEILNDCRMASSDVQYPIAARLFSWVPGVTLNSHGSSVELISEVGRALGIAKKALDGFDHSSFHRYHAWDLSQFADVSKFFPFIEDARVKDQVTEVHHTFLTHILPLSEAFPKSIVLGQLLHDDLLKFS
jgi:Ser/Thr protein kinase RdoA (MazF antagonist)